MIANGENVYDGFGNLIASFKNTESAERYIRNQSMGKFPAGWLYSLKSCDHWNFMAGSEFRMALPFRDAYKVVPLYEV